MSVLPCPNAAQGAQKQPAGAQRPAEAGYALPCSFVVSNFDVLLSSCLTDSLQQDLFLLSLDYSAFTPRCWSLTEFPRCRDRTLGNAEELLAGNTVISSEASVKR